MPKQNTQAPADDGGVSADTFLEHDRAVRIANSKREAAVSEARTARKRAKSNGVDLDAYTLHEKLKKMDPDDALRWVTRALQYGRWAGAAYATQFDMFKPIMGDNSGPTEKSRAAQAEFDTEEAGRMVGAGGGDRGANPHKEGTALYVAWDKGFLNGWEFFEGGGGKVVTAEKRGRGRPRGSKNKGAETGAATASDDGKVVPFKPNTAADVNATHAEDDAIGGPLHEPTIDAPVTLQ